MNKQLRSIKELIELAQNVVFETEEDKILWIAYRAVQEQNAEVGAMIRKNSDLSVEMLLDSFQNPHEPANNTTLKKLYQQVQHNTEEFNDWWLHMSQQKS